tara:strand:+ start:2751 stop:3230 length:480 start_codon:yes stop_codon:yes gene_type:complete
VKTIYSDKVSNVYLFDRIDEPNHPHDGIVKAALRDFLCGVSLSCKEPVKMYWNKSDTNTYAVVAVGFKELGVDIEYMRERRFEDISRRYFHKDEITDDKEIFFDLWCQKEAYTKWKKGKIAKYLSQKIDKDMTSLVPQSRYQMIELEELPDNIKGYLCY